MLYCPEQRVMLIEKCYCTFRTCAVVTCIFLWDWSIHSSFLQVFLNVSSCRTTCAHQFRALLIHLSSSAISSRTCRSWCSHAWTRLSKLFFHFFLVFYLQLWMTFLLHVAQRTKENWLWLSSSSCIVLRWLFALVKTQLSLIKGPSSDLNSFERINMYSDYIDFWESIWDLVLLEKMFSLWLIGFGFIQHCIEHWFWWLQWLWRPFELMEFHL